MPRYLLTLFFCFSFTLFWPSNSFGATQSFVVKTKSDSFTLEKLSEFLLKTDSHHVESVTPLFRKKDQTDLSEKNHLQKLQTKLSKRKRLSKNIKNRFLNRYFKIETNFDSLEEEQKFLELLKLNPSIHQASKNENTPLNYEVNDPYLNSNSLYGYNSSDLWNLDIIRAQTAWDKTLGSPTVLVAVIDTGIDRNHADIASNIAINSLEDQGTPQFDDDDNNYADDIYGYNFYQNNNNTMDNIGHGTHVAGTIAAIANNNYGIVGIAPLTKILPIKVCESSCPIDAVVKGIVYATDRGADVINMSLGGPLNSGVELYQDAVSYAHDHGVVIVVSAGNDGENTNFVYPASLVKTISVASSTTEDTLSSFSNRGATVDLAAPGGGDFSNSSKRNILSLKSSYATNWGSYVIDHDFMNLAGTSMAAPLVSGTAALLLAQYPDLTPEEIRQILKKTSADHKNQLTEIQSGRLDAGQALNLARDYQCEALITSPKSYSVQSSSHLEIQGFANGEASETYKLTIKKGRFSQNERLITEDIANKTDELLGNYNLENQFGLFVVTLQVFTSSGQECGHDEKAFHLSPLSPVITYSKGAFNQLETGHTLKTGDFNQDGFPDLVIGSPHNTAYSATYPTQLGRTIIMFGKPESFEQSSSLDNSFYFSASFIDRTAIDRSGLSYAILDFDGDGFDDLALARPTANQNGTDSGSVCIFRGSYSNYWGRNWYSDVGDYCFYGEFSGNFLASDVANAGDLDGDGRDDLAIAACGYNGQISAGSQRVYIVYGRQKSQLSTSQHQNINIAETITEYDVVSGQPCTNPSEFKNMKVGSSGDFNGDGFDDFIYSLLGTTNRIYGLYGSSSGLPLATDNIALFRYSNIGVYEAYDNPSYLTSQFSPAGDFNGDGFDDFLIFSKVLIGSKNKLGKASLIYGSDDNSRNKGIMHLSDTVLNNTLTQMRVTESMESGESSHADLNHDGFDDLLIAVPGDTNTHGYIAIILGGKPIDGPLPIFERADLIISSEALGLESSSEFAKSIAVADFNQDGLLDIVVSAPKSSQSIYVFNIFTQDSHETDLDWDGFTTSTGDCDDRNPLKNPNIIESINNEDDNCNNLIDDNTEAFDDDGDGFSEQEGDCRDDDLTIYPGATEHPNNIDDDCDDTVDEGTINFDDDGDGYAEISGDCDDTNNAIHPHQIETPNSIDDDCNQIIDDNTIRYDDDGDGQTELQGDCDDSNPQIFRGQIETINNLDDNCNNLIDDNTTVYDDDHDGYTEEQGDCDDTSYSMNPGLREWIDNLDNDCNGIKDDHTNAYDDDGDGFSEQTGDCNDQDPQVFPGQIEILNLKDDNCNGLLNEGTTQYDDDGDGFSEEQGDCNDANPNQAPFKKEIINNEDTNCDNEIDNVITEIVIEEDSTKTEPNPISSEQTENSDSEDQNENEENDSPNPISNQPVANTPSENNQSNENQVVSNGSSGGCSLQTKQQTNTSYMFALIPLLLICIRQQKSYCQETTSRKPFSETG